MKDFRCAATDHTGNIWVGTEYGIFVFNKLYQLIAHYEQSERDLSALNDSPIYSLYQDKAHNMWVGTYFGGVNYYIFGSDQFQIYPYGASFNHLSGKAVRQIINAPDNGLYIATEDGGLNYRTIRKKSPAPNGFTSKCKSTPRTYILYGSTKITACGSDYS